MQSRLQLSTGPMHRLCGAFLIGTIYLASSLLSAQPAPPAKVPILLDTDIGAAIDDALALALALSSPELDLRGITTVHGDTYTKALIVCRFLHAVGRADIPVAAASPPRETPETQGQFQYGLRPAFRKRPERELAVDFLYRQLKAHPGELTLVAVGPLTNCAELLTKHPDAKPWIKRIVLMGGSIHVGYKENAPPEVEWNIRTDTPAAQAVFRSGVPLVVAPLDATTALKLEPPALDRVLTARTPVSNQLEALYQLWGERIPTLFDPLAVTLVFDERFCKLEDLRLDVDGQGFTRVVSGKPNARVALSTRSAELLKWFAERIAPAAADTPAAQKPHTLNPSSIVARGGMPNRVHVLEDYETDIERRWWLCGQLETKNVPPGSRRACRGVLTNDFDGRMGDARSMYTAVIFNPVPGPPMGKNTRLSFRYWLKGTSTLRVQIYSLSNGYHRCLTLRDLPQGTWQAAAVDMTAARKPDGTGGALAENERIDDIQFYVERSAELLIDDIVLHDAAGPEETRPFPERLLFTGWFDTGRQGKEWPGAFEIVAKPAPLTWKAARSVPNSELKVPWIRLNLRGDRPVGERVALSFHYRIAGADSMRVQLAHRGRSLAQVEAGGLRMNEWATATLHFPVNATVSKVVDEIRFLLPQGAELLLDDVLLYVPRAPSSP